MEERIKARKNQKGGSSKEQKLTFLQQIRGYLDALVFAYVLAMFIRSFVFELFMIPTGSMTPTLIGDQRGEVVMEDYDGDGIKDVIYTMRSNSGRVSNNLQIFLMNEDGTYKDFIFVENANPSDVIRLAGESEARRDMIIVNKFAFWFSPPERGDIAVFKVPYNEYKWDVERPVYIKRTVGLPGESIAVRPTRSYAVGVGDEKRYSNRYGGTEIHLDAEPVLADGSPITEARFDHLFHFPPPSRPPVPHQNDEPSFIEVPDDAVLMLGDNASSSLDGRYFGAVPRDHLRGEAVFRYWPWAGFGFLEPGNGK